MPELSGIYDSAPIQPVCRIKENLSVFTQNKWRHYLANSMDPWPAGSVNRVDMVTQAGVAGRTTLAANGTFAKEIVQILQLNVDEFVHLRFYPIDDIECRLWEISGQPRFNINRVHARVDRNTRRYDPYWATTTFWILGKDRDMNLEVFNPNGFAMPTARVQFFGFRADVTEYKINDLLDKRGIPRERASEYAKALERGDRDIVKELIGFTTWLPGELITG